MSLEFIRHEYSGSTLGRAICSDPACRTKVGEKILHDEFNGYGEKARDLTLHQQQEVFESAANHLELHPDHLVRIIYFHKDIVTDPATGHYKIIYQHGSQRDSTL